MVQGITIWLQRRSCSSSCTSTHIPLCGARYDSPSINK